METHRLKTPWHVFLATAGVVAVYVAGANLGLGLLKVQGVSAPFWPPTGIALAALLLFGPRMAGAVFLGAFLSSYGLTGPVLAKATAGLGAASEAVIGWWIVTRLAGPAVFESLRGIVIFFMAAVAGAVFYALAGTAAAIVFGVATWESYWRVVAGWAVGDAIGVVLLTPAIMTLANLRGFGVTRRMLLEGAALTAGAVAVAMIVYGGHALSTLDLNAASWTVLPFIIIAALRLGVGGTAVVGLAVSLVAAGHAASGIGYFGGDGAATFVSLQMFIGITTVTGLLLAVGNAERDRAVAEVRRLSSAVEQSAASVMITDTDGRLEYVNPKFTETSGWTAAEVIGQTPRILRSGHVAPEVYADLWRTLKGGDVWTGEFLNRRKDGSLWWEHAAIAPVRDGHGRVTHFVAVKEDITERKRTERRLRGMVDELQRSNRELQHFASIAAHDLQEPLRAMSGFAQLLRRRYGDRLDADGEHYIDFMVTSAAHMKALFRDLMDYSQIDTRPVAGVPVPLGEVVAHVRDAMARELEAAGASVVVGPLPTVPGDRAQLALVFQHMLSNACKFRHPERPVRIVVGAAWTREAWQVHVIDNGIGIQQDHLKGLFVLFRRLHTRQEYEGTGIGLAISRRIVERHGGRIWAESDGITGTAIRFTLPDAAARLMAATASAAEEPGGSGRILEDLEA